MFFPLSQVHHTETESHLKSKIQQVKSLGASVNSIKLFIYLKKTKTKKTKAMQIMVAGHFTVSY